MKSMNRMKAIRRITTLVMLFIIIFCFAVTGFDKIGRASCRERV